MCDTRYSENTLIGMQLSAELALSKVHQSEHKSEFKRLMNSQVVPVDDPYYTALNTLFIKYCIPA